MLSPMAPDATFTLFQPEKEKIKKSVVQPHNNMQRYQGRYFPFLAAVVSLLLLEALLCLTSHSSSLTTNLGYTKTESEYLEA